MICNYPEKKPQGRECDAKKREAVAQCSCVFLPPHAVLGRDARRRSRTACDCRLRLAAQGCRRYLLENRDPLLSQKLQQGGIRHEGSCLPQQRQRRFRMHTLETTRNLEAREVEIRKLGSAIQMTSALHWAPCRVQGQRGHRCSRRRRLRE